MGQSRKTTEWFDSMIFANKEQATGLGRGTLNPVPLYPQPCTLTKFFDILEEVKKEEQTAIGDCCVCAPLTRRELKSRMRHHDKSKKSIPYGAKGVQVEESNKEYTGDALALRGDEGRDKLR